MLDADPFDFLTIPNPSTPHPPTPKKNLDKLFHGHWASMHARHDTAASLQ